MEQANKHNPTIIIIYRCDFLNRHNHIQGPKIQQRVVDIRTHFKPTGTFQYTFCTTCHSLRAKKGFVKGEALRLLGRYFSNKTFEEKVTTFEKHLMEGGYPQNVINNTLSEVNFHERTQALLQRNKTKKRILRFVTQYHTAVPSLKEILTRKWYLIQQQPLLNQVKEPSIISCRRGRSLKDMLVRAKL